MATNDDISMDGLFSSHVVTVCGVPTELQETLHPVELATVENAVEKRRLEFIAGRTFARRALRQLGFGDVSIPVGKKREPLWPPGIVGSISHTRGFCGVAVARSGDVRGLGFDVEHVSEVRAHIHSHIASDKELRALQQALGGDVERALALAFSGKESFFKYQYPLIRRWVDFRQVELRAEPGGFSIVPAVDLAGACAKGEPVRGSFAFRGPFVLTAIEVAA